MSHKIPQLCHDTHNTRSSYALSVIIVWLLLANQMKSFGAELPKSIDFKPDGRFSASGIEFSILACNSRWHGIENQKWKDKKRDAIEAGMRFGGVFFIDGVKATVCETLRGTSENAFGLSATIKLEKPIKTNRIYATLRLPLKSAAITIDGKKLSIPGKLDNQFLFEGKPQTVSIRCFGSHELCLSGLASLQVQDNRKFDGDTLSLRIPFFPEKTDDAKLTCSAKFSLRNISGTQIDIAKFTNRAFIDEIAGDGKGGWTDQGADFDFRKFNSKKISVMGLDFKIVDPSQNNGYTVIAVGGVKRGGLPKEISLTLPDNIEGEAINLLHTSAWTPGGNFGEIEYKMANGTSHIQVVSGKIDCGDWVNPKSRNNGYVAWEGERPGAKIGAYISSFALPKGKIEKIIFRATSKKVAWLIMGVLISDKVINFPQVALRDSTIVTGKDWVKLSFDNNVAKDSALDFSAMLDAPAGKYGFVFANEKGELSFEKAPDRRLRLHGINFCQSACFPSRKSADKIAGDLAKSGFNSIRIHHHDGKFSNADANDTITFDPEMMDRLDYFFAACKKRGLYITTDFYISRRFREGDNIPEGLLNEKALFFISKAALENWKAFVRRWMTHENPYTGLAWGEDPALVMVNLVNEDNIPRIWDHSVATRDLYVRKFEEWKKSNNVPHAKADIGDRRFLSFLCETQMRVHAKMKDFVKNELKVKALLTSLNHKYEAFFTPMRKEFDIVDNHQYHAHPNFIGKQWQLPAKYTINSAISGLASLPRAMMPTRVTQKPFTVTEYNYCRPNHFRAEGGPLMGAYAALQNWDGVYRFCYSHNIKRIDSSTRATGFFESVNDPLMQLSDRIVASMFLRGDVKKSDSFFSYGVPQNPTAEDFSLSFPLKYNVLGLVSGIGSHVIGGELPSQIIKISKNTEFSEAISPELIAKWRNAVENKIAVSSTNEIRLDAGKETFIVNTPFTESLTLAKGNLSTGNVLAVDSVDGFQTIAAISIDGNILKDSRRILLLHLTDVTNSNILFGDEVHTILKALGELPLLLRKGTSKISLSLAPGKTPKVKALSADGEEYDQIPCKDEPNSVYSFKANTAAFPGGVMAYEIVR